MVLARHVFSKRSETLPAFTYGIFLGGPLLMVRETLAAAKMSVTFVAGNSNAFELEWRARHIIAIRLVTHVRNVSPTPFATFFTHVPFSHITFQVCHHVIISFDIILD